MEDQLHGSEEEDSNWQLNLSRDEAVPPEIERKWSIWIENLPSIQNFSIPRRFTTHDSPVVFQAVHGFCDAFSLAYGVAIYIRKVHKDGVTSVALVTAKARVFPIKPVTIPRAELLGAHLLSKLVLRVALLLDIPLTNIFAWTDSDVIHWLVKKMTKLDRFVTNRVSKITNSLPASHWCHILSKDNPADLASRGLHAKELTESDIWWKAHLGYACHPINGLSEMFIPYLLHPAEPFKSDLKPTTFRLKKILQISLESILFLSPIVMSTCMDFAFPQQLQTSQKQKKLTTCHQMKF